MYIVVKKNGKKSYYLTKNISEEELIEIGKSRKENVRFSHSGRVYDPSTIDKITVFETAVKFRELAHNGKGLLGRARVVARLLQTRQVEGVKIVTNRYIKGVPKEKATSETEPTFDKKNVFIVHGRDHKPMKELKTLLIDLGFNPIVLREQAGGGSPTLVEKLEKQARRAGYAFVILTPEDVGGHRDEVRKKLGEGAPLLQRNLILQEKSIDKILNYFEPRARQNVIFEMGYFFGLLRRNRVCCLLKGEMENPSDIDGVEYGHFENSINEKEIREKIIKELEAYKEMKQ